MFHMVKIPVYRIDLYGGHRTLCTDDDYFWWYYLEVEYKPKYQIWCESDFPCTQDNILPILYGRYQTLWTDDDNFW